MSKYYVDFVGLNTFIYEPNGWDINEQGLILSEDQKITLDSINVAHEGAEFIKLQHPTTVLNAKQNHIGGYRYADDAGVYYDVTKIADIKYVINGKFYNAGIALSGHTSGYTPDFFNVLITRRNGPYGYPMWKQTRVGQNPLTRKQKQNNVLTIVQEPGPEFSFKRNNRLINSRARFGDILKFNETPVLSKFKPLVVYGSTILEDGVHRVAISVPVGNSISQFNNPQLNEELGLVDLKSRLYEEAKDLYLNGALFGSKSPLDVFEVITYGETIYPPQLFTYRKFTRQRTTFTFPWRDIRSERTPQQGVPNNFGSTVSQSVWVMDAYSAWETQPDFREDIANAIGYTGYNVNINGVSGSQTDYGILQNQYSTAVKDLVTNSSFDSMNELLRPAPLYNRKQMQTALTSAVNINGMRIEGVNTGSLFADIDLAYHLPSGEAKWEAGAQSGKNPFYNSYEEYVQGAKQLGKDYTILPEFKISDHVSFYETNSSIEENLNVFEITGGLANTTGSNQDNFYQIYSNSDFMKNFEMVVNDNETMGEPLKITLKCKAIKKLLPYEGFYPQQRTVQIAQRFFDSYSGSMSLSGAANTFGDEPAQIGFQNALTPLFAPGIMYNSIKSGVAVDYPLVSRILKEENPDDRATTNSMVIEVVPNSNTSPAFYLSFSGSRVSSTTEYSINDGLIFDKRLPFETLLKPETLQGIELFCNEPSPIANHSSSATLNSVAGDRLYTLMMHNFLAETSNFFLQNKRYTTFFSKPSNQLKQFEGGKEYMMRIKMYKTTEGAQASQVSGGVNLGNSFSAPQYSSGSYENFTMYSRPTAFGPPSLIYPSQSIGGLPAIIAYTQGEAICPVPDPNPVFFGNNSMKGENYPFTPPYYHGQAWADIKFTPEEDGIYTAKDIQRSASITYYRYVHPETDTGENIFDIPIGSSKTLSQAYAQNNYYNKNALQLSASVNIFNVERDESGDLNEETARLVIQSKWESPMLNFAHLSASDSVTLPINGSQSVPRGMWHQYGLIEKDQAKGVFLQVEDIDSNWLKNILGKDTSNVISLADHLDFSTKPKRMGEIADEKIIHEAVVAVPFIEQEGHRKYFHIPRADIRNALSNNAGTGDSIVNMINKMAKYNFPPNMDFMRNESLEPFAMYIFEFSCTLDKQDLADIWQGLYPKVTTKFESVTAQISHPLLAHELLGGGGTVFQQSGGGKVLDTSDQGTPLPPKIRWMVFKVKQKASTNYWQSVIGTEGDKLDEVPQNTFNWPYDFCSIIELAKLDAEVAIGKFEPGGTRSLIQPQGKLTEAAVPVSEALTDEARSSVGTGAALLGGASAIGTNLAAIAAGTGGTQGGAIFSGFIPQGGSNSEELTYDRTKPRSYYTCEQLRAFQEAGADLRNAHRGRLASQECGGPGSTIGEGYGN